MKKKSDKRRLIWIAAIAVVLMLAAALCLWPAIRRLAQPEAQADFERWVRGLGAWGILVMLGLQALQIVLSFLPGEPIEILSGLLYGALGGTAICLAGCAAASSAVFLLMRRYGGPAIRRALGDDRLAKLSFLTHANRLETIVFLLFLIPGAPKDILTYAIAGLSPMKLPTFLLLSLPARIPSVVSSTLIGSNVAHGNWVIVGIIFAVTAALGLLCIRNRDRLAEILRRIGQGHGGDK